MKVVLSRRKLLNLNVIKEQSLINILVWFDSKNEKKIIFKCCIFKPEPVQPNEIRFTCTNVVKSILRRYCLGECIRENLIKTMGNGGIVK